MCLPSELLSSLTLQVFYICGAHFPSTHTNQNSMQVEDEHQYSTGIWRLIESSWFFCWHNPVNTRSWGSRSRAPAPRWPWAPSSVVTSAFQGHWMRTEPIFCFHLTHAASLFSFYSFDFLVFLSSSLSQIQSRDLHIHLKLRETRWKEILSNRVSKKRTIRQHESLDWTSWVFITDIFRSIFFILKKKIESTV